MRDPRCWQAEASGYKSLRTEEVRVLALDLASGEADTNRLWAQNDESGRGASLNVTGVREHFVDLVRADLRLRDRWTRHLEDRVRGLLADLPNSESGLGSRRRVPREALEALLKTWKVGADPAAIWDHPSRQLDYFPDIRGFGDANLLVQINPAVACEALEPLILPTFIQQGMEWGHRLSEDRELLLEVLRVAPAVFDGDTWTRNVVALLALELAVEHAAKLEHALRILEHQSPWHIDMPQANRAAHAVAVERLRSSELPGWLRLAFEQVLCRADGRKMLLLLLPLLCRRVLHARQMGQPTCDPNELALDQLAGILRDVGVTTAELRDEWQAHEAIVAAHAQAPAAKTAPPTAEGARSLIGEGVPYLIGALSLLLSVAPNNASVTELAEIWKWFDTLLQDRAPDLERLEHATGAHNLVRQLGLVLSRLTSPGASFADTYRRLEPQRRRAEHGYRYDDYQRNVESMLLLRVALSAAENMVTDVADRSAARSLFHQAYAYARRLWLTQGGADNSKPEGLVAICFAYIPAIFGEAVPDVVPSLVAPIAADSGLTLAAANYLRLNRVPVDAIVALFVLGGANLVEMAREEREWWGQGDGRPSWFVAIEPLLQCLEPDRSQMRHAAIGVRARERSLNLVLRGPTMLDDWLAAEHEVARAELEAVSAV